MNIPGYYYDQLKNRYFKISNGDLGSSYHNNKVTRMERQKHIAKHAKRSRYNDNSLEVEGMRSDEDAMEAEPIIPDEDSDKNGEKKQSEAQSPLKSRNQSIKFKLLYLKCSLGNVRLGLTRSNHTLLEFERLGNLKLINWVYYGGLETKIWEKFTINDDIYIIITDQYRNFMVLDVQTMLSNLQEKNMDLKRLVINFQDNLNVNVNLMELINKLNLLPFEYLTVSGYKNLIFYNFISESDLDNPQIYQNFIRLNVVTKVNGRMLKLDKLNYLYHFINNLPDGEIKKDLYHLFGMNVILNVDADRYEYRPVNLKNYKRFFITFSKFIDEFLILGTNMGIVYLIKFQYIPDAKSSSNLRFFQDVIKFKFDRSIKLDKISQIHKIDDYLFISSFKTLIILNVETNEKFSYKFTEIIKNFRAFKVLTFFKIVVVSYKKIHVVNFSTQFNQFEALVNYSIFNDNLINQFSFVTLKNNLVINQSNNSLLVLNLNNFTTKQIVLNQVNQKINGLIRLTENYLLISFKNADNTNYFNVYQV